MPCVTVKWGQQKLELDVDTEQEPLVFKSQLFAMTGVPPDRQKLMCKGKTLKDESWGGLTLQDGQMLMMMGSAVAVPQQPKFESSNTIAGSSADTELDENGEEKVRMPPGLKNLGNTCYMNATLQSFAVIPELMEGIKKWTSKGTTKVRQDLLKDYTGVVYNLFNQLTTGTQEFYVPLIPLTYMQRLFPQFATTGKGGEWQQQDANECFMELLRIYSDAAEANVMSEGDIKQVTVRRFLEGQFEIKWRNKENLEEVEQTTTESFMQLSCFLTQEVRYLQSGIKSKLSEEIEKYSESMGKNCIYQKEALISRLPMHLSIQLVRFFYKEKDQVNAKILKDVKFPMVLDMFDCCTPELQTKLRPARDAFKDYDETLMEQQRAAKLAHRPDPAEARKKKPPTKFAESSFKDDAGSNNSGFYQLNAVITHKGRSSNSGHYVAWIRVKGDKWAMCDDEDVYPVTEEQILKLSGGGDWHTAYVLLYGPCPLPLLEKEPIKETVT